MIINLNNFWVWLIGGMVGFMITSTILAYYVDTQLLLLILGAMAWMGFMLFVIAPKLGEESQLKWKKIHENEIADYMKREREEREI